MDREAKIEKQAKAYSLAEPRELEVMGYEHDYYDIHTFIGWLRVLKPKKGCSIRDLLRPIRKLLSGPFL